MFNVFKKRSFILLLIILLTGCQLFASPEPTPTPQPEPTPLPLKELSICLGYEPQSLYPYLANSQAAHDVLQAIYDGPIDMRIGQAIPVILEEMPSQATGSASYTVVDVKAGDEVINTAGYPVSLRAGVRVFPAGCYGSECAITWDGNTPLQLNQLSAVFRLKDGVSWSDGQPVHAADVLFGFQVAADPATPLDRLALDQTSDYRVLDERRVEWIGKPGLVTDAFEDYFWMPLPEHAWGAYTAGQLLEHEEVNRRPLGWGAFEVLEWEAGEFIRLGRNPFYFRASEGLPYYDHITFTFNRFQDGNQVRAAGGETCDVITPSALELLTAKEIKELTANAASLQLLQKPTNRVEVLPLGIKPVSYDDRYYPYGEDRPDIFGDVRMRQALAHCINRADIVDTVYAGLAVVADVHLPSGHALLDGADLTRYAYDPERGKGLLEEAGWMDSDQNPDTPRASIGTIMIPPGTPLELNLLYSEADVRAGSAQRIAADLKACGFQVNLESKPARELYQPAPEGLLFGRKFDLALMSWALGDDLRCELFTTREIPTRANNWLGETSGGWNFMGYSNPEYDQICEQFNNRGVDTDAGRSAAQDMLKILSADLPYIPLFGFTDPYLASGQVCGLILDLSSNSVFQEIENLSESGCNY